MNDNVEENKGTMKERESIAGTRGGGNVFLLKFFRQVTSLLQAGYSGVMLAPANFFLPPSYG